MNAANSTRSVKSGVFIVSIAMLAAGAGLMNLRSTPSPALLVYELPRVVVTGQRVTKVDSDVAQRVVRKSAVRG